MLMLKCIISLSRAARHLFAFKVTVCNNCMRVTAATQNFQNPCSKWREIPHVHALYPFS